MNEHSPYDAVGHGVDSVHSVHSVLDDPIGASLRGPHADLALRRGQALCYPRDVSPFAAPPDDPRGWQDLADLLGAGSTAIVATLHPELPTGWALEEELPGVQMVDTGPVAAAARPDPDAVVLTHADVPDILDLVARTRPGPFGPRTITLGRYLGIREGGRLVAMAGERLRPPGWTEVSAVCTDPDHRGRGLAARLVLAVAAGIQERGEAVFLHTTAANSRAIQLYEHLGFRIRVRPFFRDLRAPAEIDTETGTDTVRGSVPS